MKYGEYNVKVEVNGTSNTLEYIDDVGFKLQPIEVGSIKLTYDNKNGSEYPNETWSNKSVYATLLQGNANTIYIIENTLESTKEDYTLSKEGTYKLIVKTDDGVNDPLYKNYIVNIDKTRAEVSSIQVVSPDDGVYKEGQEIQIKVIFSENVYKEYGIIQRDSLDKNSVPVLKIRIGDGEVKTVGYKSNDKNTITYIYTVSTGDNGKVIVDGFEGVVYDIAGNETTLGKQTVSGNNVIADTVAPIITNVTGNPTDWTNQNVTLKIEGAKDAISGLDDKPYSFDNGVTWQTENTKTYEENQDNIIIKVRDRLGNVYTHPAISITKIDKQEPSKPTVTLKLNNVSGSSYTSNTWTNQNVFHIVESSDSLSGILKYQISVNDGEYQDMPDWTTTYNDDKTRYTYIINTDVNSSY